MAEHQARRPRRTPDRGVSRANVVVERVLDFIEAEGLEPGDSLPSIRALTERFGVATPTLREALRRLEATNVLEIHHGSGVFLRQEHDRLFLWNVNSRSLDPGAILDMLEARMVVEPHLAQLAAARATDAELAKLEATLSQARENLELDQAVHDNNMEFHCLIGRSSGSTVLAQTLESYVDMYADEQMTVLSLHSPDLRIEDQGDHQAIYQAILNRDPVLARDLMHEHLRNVKLRTEQKLSSAD